MMDRWRIQLGLLLLAVASSWLFFADGCRDDSQSELRRIQTLDGRQTQSQSQNHFATAMDFLEYFEQYTENSAIEKIHTNLNQWTVSQRPAEGWIADPLFNRLPDQLRLRRDAAALSRLKFNFNDVLTLREATWTRDLAKVIVQQDLVGSQWDRWLDEQADTLGRGDTANLRSCIKIFDWVVRNIQLDPFEIVDATGLPAERLIEVPPGVTRFAWQALLTGHGDAWTRARILILIARQLDLPVVMLAVDKESAPEPWLAAAVIGDRLYLFDPVMGLPFPDGDGRGVATLTELVANPGWLRRLDLSNERRYGYSKRDLGNLVALIDATEQALSQRMKLIEAGLSGDAKMVLTAKPSVLRRRLTEHDAIQDASLWTLPYFQWQFARTMSGDRSFAARQLRDRRLFVDGSVLAKARRLHFLGKIRGDSLDPGATQLYLQCRVPDEIIEHIGDSAEARKQIGLSERLPEEPVLRQNLIAVTVSSITEAKGTASYWLGLISQEDQNYDVAIAYLEKRTLAANPSGPWTHGASYNLARVFELLGRRDGEAEKLRQARELYESVANTPQAHGNAIRARQLGVSLDELEPDS